MAVLVLMLRCRCCVVVMSVTAVCRFRHKCRRVGLRTLTVFLMSVALVVGTGGVMVPFIMVVMTPRVLCLMSVSVPSVFSLVFGGLNPGSSVLLVIVVPPMGLRRGMMVMAVALVRWAGNECAHVHCGGR